MPPAVKARPARRSPTGAAQPSPAPSLALALALVPALAARLGAGPGPRSWSRAPAPALALASVPVLVQVAGPAPAPGPAGDGVLVGETGGLRDPVWGRCSVGGQGCVYGSTSHSLMPTECARSARSCPADHRMRTLGS